MNNEVTEWPASGDVYYWVRSDTGDICQAEYIPGKASTEFRESIGNIFRSRADAKLAIIKLQAKIADRRVALK